MPEPVKLMSSRTPPTTNAEAHGLQNAGSPKQELEEQLPVAQRFADEGDQARDCSGLTASCCGYGLSVGVRFMLGCAGFRTGQLQQSNDT